MNYYDFALKDLRSAETLLKHTQEYDVIAVSCQQYLEKAFKHLLQLKCGEISKSHKLVTLVKLLGINDFYNYINFLREVQDFYFDKRYPSMDYIETTEEEAKRVFSETMELKRLIEMHIKRQSVNNTTSMSAFDEFR